MENISIGELAARTRDTMISMSYMEHSAWKEYADAMLPLVRWHQNRGLNSFEHEAYNDYLDMVSAKLDGGELAVTSYNALHRAAERMSEMHETGKLLWSYSRKVSRFKLNDFYEKLVSDFATSQQWHENTLGDVVWVSRKFFAWLIQNGYADLTKVGAAEIQKFVIYCGKTLKSSSVHDVQLYLKKLCRDLFERGLLPTPYEALLSFRVARETRIQPTTPPDEIAAILSAVDRHTPKGKRDYAVILLGVFCGLRAIDIVKLKLTDIDYRRGEINITQSKTGQLVQLPLTEDVGEALKDYILHARPKIDVAEVFLRIRGPVRPFVNGVAIGEIYECYRKKANLTKTAFDGKGFHSLRRTFGTNLVTNDIPVTLTAQMLGDVDVNSIKKYVSLDSKHLKECALDFQVLDGEVSREF